MNPTVKKIWDWVKEYGTLWFVRVVFVVTAAYWALSGIGLPWAPFDTKIVCGLNIAVLWLVFERLNAGQGRQPHGTVMSWNTFGAHANFLIHQASEVDIICSSGGTFHTQFGDALSLRSNIKIRILMRAAGAEFPQRREKLRELIGFWMAMDSPHANRTVEIRLTSQDIIRGMRINETVALGYYGRNSLTQRLVGHTFDFIVVEPFQPDSPYFRRFFLSIYERLWDEGTTIESAGLKN